MARTKWTLMKKVGGGQIPQLPSTVRWALQKPAKKMGNALHLETPKLLWDVLRELRYSHLPLYSGVHHPLGDRDYTWSVKAILFLPQNEGNGYRVLKRHMAIAPWTT